MENRAFTTQPPGPCDGAEKPRHTEQLAEPGYQGAAAPALSAESRATEAAVATDGQMVEAGYGHGV